MNISTHSRLLILPLLLFVHPAESIGKTSSYLSISPAPNSSTSKPVLMAYNAAQAQFQQQQILRQQQMQQQAQQRQQEQLRQQQQQRAAEQARQRQQDALRRQQQERQQQQARRLQQQRLEQQRQVQAQQAKQLQNKRSQERLQKQTTQRKQRNAKDADINRGTYALGMMNIRRSAATTTPQTQALLQRISKAKGDSRSKAASGNGGAGGCNKPPCPPGSFGGSKSGGGDGQGPRMGQEFKRAASAQGGASAKPIALTPSVTSLFRKITAEKAGNALKFGKHDLVYGPSATGKLAALRNKSGGKTLDDLHRGKEVNESWLKYSKRVLDSAAETGKQVHFDLTHVKNVKGVLNSKGPHSESITSSELRYIRDNWEKFKTKPKFYKDGSEVKPPWS